MLSTNIKEYTKTAHQQLEKIVVAKLKEIRNEEDYAELLRYFYAYFSEIEAATVEFINEAILPDYQERRKTVRLKTDIETLGSNLNSLPVVTLPVISSAAEAMGAMYVMEGSVMGGPIIIGMLKKHGIQRGFSFFSGYGPATGEMWRRFTIALNQIGNTHSSQAKLMETAAQTFLIFTSIFQSGK